MLYEQSLLDSRNSGFCHKHRLSKRELSGTISNTHLSAISISGYAIRTKASLHAKSVQMTVTESIKNAATNAANKVSETVGATSQQVCARRCATVMLLNIPR